MCVWGGAALLSPSPSSTLLTLLTLTSLILTLDPPHPHPPHPSSPSPSLPSPSPLPSSLAYIFPAESDVLVFPPNFFRAKTQRRVALENLTPLSCSRSEEGFSKVDTIGEKHWPTLFLHHVLLDVMIFA